MVPLSFTSTGPLRNKRRVRLCSTLRETQPTEPMPAPGITSIQPEPTPGGAAGEAPLVASQEKAKPSRRLNTSSRFAHLPVPIDLSKGNLEVHIQHRFLGSVEEGGIGNLFGVDFGANINLGLTYALTDKIAVSASRARLESDGFSPVIAFNGIYELHNKESSFWNMSLVGGLEGSR